jgi:1-phosphofructokinase
VTRPVLTVTLNPAIDRTVWVDELIPGTTHRTADTRATFGGKGINVARVVARSGTPVLAIGLAGEDQAAPMEHDLGALGVQARFVRVPGETRTNLKIIDQRTGRLTEINGSGPEVDPALVEALEAQLLSAIDADGAAAVVLAGSLPLGVEASVYARWTELLKSRTPQVRVLVDASDDALELVVPAAPFLVKPNRDEAETLTGRHIEDVDDAVDAAGEIAGRGPVAVLLSLGPRGAVAVWGPDDAAKVIDGHPHGVAAGQLRSTVGAGDAMVARIAVELARLGDAPIGADEFFAMSRLAVAEAESQISASTPAHVPAQVVADTPAISAQPVSPS